MVPVYREDVNISDNQNNMYNKLKNSKKIFIFCLYMKKK